MKIDLLFRKKKISQFIQDFSDGLSVFSTTFNSAFKFYTFDARIREIYAYKSRFESPLFEPKSPTERR